VSPHGFGSQKIVLKAGDLKLHPLFTGQRCSAAEGIAPARLRGRHQQMSRHVRPGDGPTPQIAALLFTLAGVVLATRS
jgi:hypothetical protein